MTNKSAISKNRPSKKAVTTKTATPKRKGKSVVTKNPNKINNNNKSLINPPRMKSYSFEELEDHYFGKAGTPSRTAYEREFIEDTVAELVKQLRKHFDITQDELASRTGMTKSYISRIENNKKNQNVDTIFKIIRAFNARLFIRLEMDNKPLNEFQLT